MTLKTGDIRTFTLITGMEIMAEIVSVEDGYYSVKEAFGLVSRDDGKGKLVFELRPLSAFATAQTPTGGLPLELYFSTLLLSTPPPDGFLEHYNQIVNPHLIAVPPEQKIVVPR